MSKQASTIEWYIAQNDADWERLCAPLTSDLMPEVAPAIHRHLFATRFVGSVVILLLLASVSGWWWRTAQAELHQQSEAEVRTTAQLGFETVRPNVAPPDVSFTGEQPRPDGWFQQAGEMHEVRTAIQAAAPDAHLNVAVYKVDVQGDQSVVRVVMSAKDSAPAYRQTLFYRRTATGWQPTMPNADFWGPVQHLETPSFIFRFHRNDAVAVFTVASQVEALYNTLRHDFGLALTPSAERLVIEVSVTQTPGNASWARMADRFVVASPALYQAPVELTDTELLAQSIALPLVNHLLAQANKQHAPGATWEPLINGLRLWQMWDLDLPLSVWQEDVVRWIYSDSPAARPKRPIVLPERYPELCAAHQLWMPYPVQIHIPLTCVDTAREEAYFTSWYALGPPTRLDQFALPVSTDPHIEAATRGSQRTYAGQTISLATVVDYAVVTYGRERLPELVASLGQHQTWDTLLPAVFGVSAAEFEAGWQAYLIDRYGVGSTVLAVH